MRRIEVLAAVLAAMLISMLFMAAAPLGAAACGSLRDDLGPDTAFLRNPNRGFYHICRAMLSDGPCDYDSMAGAHTETYPDDTLVLLEVNLHGYRSGAISPAGMENLDELLSAWDGRGVGLIVRFLYDWDGNGPENEPDDLSTVLGHIVQAGPVLSVHGDSIFCLQGLFVGSWGEMHGTKFGGDFPALAKVLDDATGNGMFLSVRTPAQLREIVNVHPGLESRLGLFNDGMLGSDTDLGTYDMADQGAERRTREQELAFQEEACLSVPNGGEVVVNNPYNDFGNAVGDMSRMHVAYLNGAYDSSVLDKWADTDLSVYGLDGLSGLDYIERRLGYRLYAAGSGPYGDGTFYIELRNAGFGTVLFPCAMVPSVGGAPLVLDLSRVYGGTSCTVVFPGLGPWWLYDTHTGEPILLAGDQPDCGLPGA